jgi:hypothetical protein
VVRETISFMNNKKELIEREIALFSCKPPGAPCTGHPDLGVDCIFVLKTFGKAFEESTYNFVYNIGVVLLQSATGLEKFMIIRTPSPFGLMAFSSEMLTIGETVKNVFPAFDTVTASELDEVDELLKGIE